MISNGTSIPYWLASADMPTYPPLSGDTRADVAVIGGGIAGLTSAYLLSREGKRVVLIEALQIGAGETGRTTAHFMPPDDRYFEIEKSFGAEAARKVAQSFAAATDLAESIARQEAPDCEFERLDGYLYCLPGQDRSILGKELEAARKAGVAIESAQGVAGLSFDTGPSLRFGSQAQFHPGRYLAGLARACVQQGVQIHGGTRATELSQQTDATVVKTTHGDVLADAVVVATNTPFKDRVVMHTKQSGYRTYVVALEVPSGSVPRVLLWDVGDPYYYVRLASSASAPESDLLIVGGADHKVGQDTRAEQRWSQLERWTRERFPMAGALAWQWSGQVMEPADGLAFFGRNPGSQSPVYVITGDSGTGMTHCTAGAIAITDAIVGRPSAWADIYDPARKATHGLGEFVKEQANTLAQYKDLLTGGDVHRVQDIPLGQGAVVRRGATKLAVYRDEQSALHVCSAICTHLGCVVHWNGAEKSWDCPCHSSRFSVEGEVLHGPAATPLKRERLDDPPA
jgi:glycine/D-amino acid oxidase-like deaminating enzyme/nitrite reductase/ring-hydroxylating ferredoxin subunit